jgi:5-methylcytosine-specific restriction endonuclease McrA
MPATQSRAAKKKKDTLCDMLMAKYSYMSEEELDRTYRNLKEEYDRIRQITQKTADAALMTLNTELKLANNELHKKYKFIKSNNTKHVHLGPLLDPEVRSLEAKIRTISDIIDRQKGPNLSEDLSKRAKLFHELRAISAIRKKLNEQRIKSLAKARIEDVRSTSQTTKKKMLSRSGENLSCPYCDKFFPKSFFVLDHIYPVSRGGLDTDSNTVLSCRSCNSKKTNKTLGHFCRDMEFDLNQVTNRLLSRGKSV